MKQYFAFLSYSHVDSKWARWLHKALETYRLPRALRALPGAESLPERMAPVFLDRAELATSTELAAEVQRALDQSSNLIVLCSPAAVKSRWVNEEIRRFRALGREDRIFCVVLGDVDTDDPGEFFPPALSEARPGQQAAENERRPEPLAADLRASADGRRDGFLKLAAGLIGVRFDQLRQREQARWHRRLMVITATSVAASVVLVGLTSFALIARREADVQRSIAEQRSLTAERTTTFLKSIFEVSDPSEARGNSITAREVLDRGARQIDEGLKREPSVRAALTTTLGTVYSSLGLYRQADEMLAKASQVAGVEPAIAAKTAIALGELRTLQGEYPEASQQFGKAVEAMSALDSAVDIDRARGLIAWGESLAITDQFAAAKEKIAAGIDRARRSRPPDAALIARGLEALGLTALLSGDLAAAEARYREALTMRIAESGQIHPKVSETLNSLGSIEYLRGNHTQAAEYFQRALGIDRKVLGPTHPDLAGTLNNLARVYLEQRKFAEARAQLLIARDLMLAEKDASHDDMAFVFSNLALADVGLGNDEEAAPLFAAAWIAAEKHRHRLRGPILIDLADLDCRQGRHSEAETRLTTAARLLAADYPDEPWRLAWLGLVQATCRLSAGDVPAAKTDLAQNLAVILRRWPDDTLYGLSSLRRALAIHKAAADRADIAKYTRRVAAASAGKSR